MTQTPFIERDCTITHKGRTFESGGAVVTDEFVIGYIGKEIPGSGMGCNNAHARRVLTDWHGNQIGTCYISSTWRTPNSFFSSTMHQVYARVNGKDYTGRSAGEGCILRAKLCK